MGQLRLALYLWKFNMQFVLPHGHVQYVTNTGCTVVHLTVSEHVKSGYNVVLMLYMCIFLKFHLWLMLRSKLQGLVTTGVVRFLMVH